MSPTVRSAPVHVLLVAALCGGGGVATGVLLGRADAVIGSTARSLGLPHAAGARMTGRSIRSTDWANIAVPGGLCKSPSPIQLHDGEALNVPSTNDGPTADYPQDVHAFVDKVTYGDVTGDGRAEATLPVICANHDSTVSGRTASGLLLFTQDRNDLRVLATIGAAKREPDQMPTHVETKHLLRGQVVVEETWYGPNDAACCASGKAVSDWRYANGRITLAGTVVTRLPGES